MNLGLKVVRVGQPVKVRELLRECTLDAKFDQHPLNQSLQDIRDKCNQLGSDLQRFQGRDKGIGQRDLNKSRKEIKVLEGRILKDIVSKADVREILPPFFVAMDLLDYPIPLSPSPDSVVFVARRWCVQPV